MALLLRCLQLLQVRARAQPQVWVREQYMARARAPTALALSSPQAVPLSRYNPLFVRSAAKMCDVMLLVAYFY